VIAIGNELLSGKVRDENVSYLAGELRRLGVRLALALFVADEPQAIADALSFARAHADAVFTTGGVGPTHDDITLRALAGALGLGLERNATLAQAIEEYYGASVNEDVLSMADMPVGAELLQPAPFFLPIVRLENIYVFPGDPRALRLLFDAWKEDLRQTPWHLIRFELDAEEGGLAPLLRDLQDGHAGLEVGSYPRFDKGAPYRVLVTLEGKQVDEVERAHAVLRERLVSDLGEACILKIETGPGSTPSGSN
jgi:molybdenum cofactor synthesis domain-containing protein